MPAYFFIARRYTSAVYATAWC